MRSPVNSLISFIQLLEDGHIEQQKLTRYAGNLKQTLGYTSAMMENLLNWASSQMQGFKPKLENFDLQLCAKEVVAGLQESAEHKGIILINHITSTTTCYADMNMTTLVLRNLISNAIKFTKEGGKVELLLTESEQQLIIAVKDSGVGLSPQDIARFNNSVYEQGVSIKNTRGTNQEKGTGLGLMLCQTFTALMHGSLHVHSEQKAGTVFTLTLPKTA
ncbi:Alkaline phosphatase synthesis sensor protein PhoR [compost metagenome]